MKTPLELLQDWIKQYKRINGTPSLFEIQSQIELCKDYEKQTIINFHVSAIESGTNFENETKFAKEDGNIVRKLAEIHFNETFKND